MHRVLLNDLKIWNFEDLKLLIKMILLQISKSSKFQNSGPRSTMDSIRVSEAPDTGSIPVEATQILICFMPTS